MVQQLSAFDILASVLKGVKDCLDSGAIGPEPMLIMADTIKALAHDAILAKLPEIDPAGRKKTVCLDVDATLAQYDGWKGIDHIGDPRPGAVAFTKKLTEFADVVIFTTRCSAEMGRGVGPELLRQTVKGWLDCHGFAYHDIWIGQGKPIMAASVDDRNVPIPPNPSEQDFARALLAVRVMLLPRS